MSALKRKKGDGNKMSTANRETHLASLENNLRIMRTNEDHKKYARAKNRVADLVENSMFLTIRDKRNYSRRYRLIERYDIIEEVALLAIG